MPIRSYSVLKGRPIAGKVVRGRGTHYQITVEAQGGPFTVAANIESFDGSEVLYTIRSGFSPPDAAGLAALPGGFTRLSSAPGGLALDFVRERFQGNPMVTLSELTPLPVASASARPLDFDRSLPAAAMGNAVTALVANAIAAGDATLYAFGSAYADAGQVDGIHDIHMNQGNPARGGHAGDNGTWQDGALFLEMPDGANATPAFTAVFIAFATESWNTDGLGNLI